MKSYRLFLISFFFLAFWQPLAAQDATRAEKPLQPLATVTVPAETHIPVSLENAINSKTAYPGQSIYCQTIFPITVDNRIVIPVGSYVKGEVTQVVKPGRIRGKAKLGIRFDSLTLPNGVTEPLRASLSSFGTSGKEGFNRKEGKIEGPSTKGKDAGRVAQTTITGAQVGTLAGISGGHTLRGLGIGSAVGAAAGAIWVLAGRGKQIYLPPGTSLELQLGAPLQFAPDQLDFSGDPPPAPVFKRGQPQREMKSRRGRRHARFGPGIFRVLRPF
jgi:type IV secretion system protein VirB10